MAKPNVSGVLCADSHGLCMGGKVVCFQKLLILTVL